jgi:hypothetical protein
LRGTGNDDHPPKTKPAIAAELTVQELGADVLPHLAVEASMTCDHKSMAEGGGGRRPEAVSSTVGRALLRLPRCAAINQHRHSYLPIGDVAVNTLRAQLLAGLV